MMSSVPPSITRSLTPSMLSRNAPKAKLCRREGELQCCMLRDLQTHLLRAVGIKVVISEMKYKSYTPVVSCFTDLSRNLAKEAYCSYAYILYLMMAAKPAVTRFGLRFAAKFVPQSPRL